MLIVDVPVFISSDSYVSMKGTKRSASSENFLLMMSFNLCRLTLSHTFLTSMSSAFFKPLDFAF